MSVDPTQACWAPTGGEFSQQRDESDISVAGSDWVAAPVSCWYPRLSNGRRYMLRRTNWFSRCRPTTSVRLDWYITEIDHSTGEAFGYVHLAGEVRMIYRHERTQQPVADLVGPTRSNFIPGR
jgi:hypothetical protein